MYIEFIIVVLYRKGKEWKWFFACILCYLTVVIPSIWILEKYVLDTRLAEVKTNDDKDCGISEMPTNNTVDFWLELPSTADSWSLILQQLLIFVLIIGRWILPRGNLTGDQLSQLLLVYIGSGADILEFASEGLRLDEIEYDITIIYVILTIWTISLVHFTLPMTAKANTQRLPKLAAGGIQKLRNGMATCCATEVWSIIVNVMTQDAPFLVIRMYLLIGKNVVNELLIFFACKNVLTILLQGNRFRVILKERIQHLRFRRSNIANNWLLSFRNTHVQKGKQHNMSDVSQQKMEEDDVCKILKPEEKDVESGNGENKNEVESKSQNELSCISMDEHK
ncbi:transmembrane protein 26-like [Antedon mediterranea]|uniref:transmembrane protein 26-like n=1 Tax=Antedon mediterranea TaxID=105859 RepID=UPI003AF6BA66